MPRPHKKRSTEVGIAHIDIHCTRMKISQLDSMRHLFQYSSRGEVLRQCWGFFEEIEPHLFGEGNHTVWFTRGTEEFPITVTNRAWLNVWSESTNLFDGWWKEGFPKSEKDVHMDTVFSDATNDLLQRLAPAFYPYDAGALLLAAYTIAYRLWETHVAEWIIVRNGQGEIVYRTPFFWRGNS
jgi:hypothetical protein